MPSLTERFRAAVRQRELARARTDLGCYAKLLYPPFQTAKHLQLLIDELQAIEHGRHLRVLLACPPRHGKTTLAQLFAAWYLGKHPGHSVIYASYSDDIAADSGRKVRNFVGDPVHQLVFPGCILSADSAAQSRFHTVTGGSFFAVGRGGAITGRGAHVLLLDDCIKDAAEASSDAVRRSLKEWYASVAYTRLAPKGAVLVVSTRWHLDDLSGWLQREHGDQGWRVLLLPAIAEENDPLGRSEGAALWPERYSLEELLAAKRQLGTQAFVSLYQGRPVAAGGAVFKLEWWRYYQTAPEMKRVVLSLDSAFKTGQSNDYSAIQVWGEAQNGYYLLSRWKGRAEFPELRRVLLSFYDQWRPNHVLIEDAASGQSLLQELRASTSLPIKPVKVDKDKVTRAQACTGMVEAGRCFLLEGLNPDYLDELSAFPSAPHDDEVDATTMALNFLRGNSADAWLGYLRLSLARERGEQSEEERRRSTGVLPPAPAPASGTVTDHFGNPREPAPAKPFKFEDPLGVLSRPGRGKSWDR